MCQREPLTSRQQAASSDAVPVGGEQRLVLWKRRRRGATMVEFSLVFVLFLTMVLGLMEFGQWIWAHHTLAHATRQAVRYAIVHGSESDAPAYPAKIKQVLSDQALGLATFRRKIRVALGAGTVTNFASSKNQQLTGAFGREIG